MEGRATQRGRGLGKVAVVAGLVAGLTYACVGASISETSPGTTSGGVPEMAARDVLVSLTDGVIVPTYRDFVAASVALEEATAAHRAAPDEETLAAAQAAFRDAMAVWQRAELMQVGPAGSMMAPGGQGLRALIYSWPLVNPCRIDQKLVDESYGDVDALTAELVNAQGLDALEYLLFHTGDDNACSAPNSINTQGTWAAIVGELTERRAAYAHNAAVVLRGHATALRDAWEDSGGDFASEVKEAGAGSAIFATTQTALNAISDGMFYLDGETKDMKLAVPAGLMDCLEETCPGAIELPHSRTSLAAVRENLVAARLIFTGGPPDAVDAPGFDDLLAQVGDPSLSTEIVEALDAAFAALDAIEHENLAQALADPVDLERVRALYQAVKKVSDLLKADFVTVLNLELPRAVEGDND
ncbi:MAG: imelysin family protein [Polyangiaceae bacterium]